MNHPCTSSRNASAAASKVKASSKPSLRAQLKTAHARIAELEAALYPHGKQLTLITQENPS